MSVFDFLFNMFDSEEDLTEVADDSAGVAAEDLPEGLTSAEFNEGVLSVCEALPPEQADVVRAAYGIAGPDGSPPPPPPAELPPPPVQVPGESDGDFVVRQVNYFHEVVNITQQTYEDNDTTIINDQDTNVDNSVNQDITAFGDVNQDFDNDVVTGDGNALGGDNSQVNSGAGAVQAGDDIEDSTIATGPVGGSVTGDVNDSIVGDGNVGIIDSDIDGAVAVGGGDAIDAENVAQGGSTIIDDTSGDVNANTGDGTQTVIDDSTISESAVGEGNTVQSNDVNVSADDGSAVAFGEGSDADSGDINSENFGGTTQIAGDESTQLGSTDNSIDTEIDVEDSFNTDNSVDNSLEVEDSFTVDDSFDTEDSFNATDSFDVEDNSTTTTDDDLIDLA
jgi:hypothetical protein